MAHPLVCVESLAFALGADIAVVASPAKEEPCVGEQLRRVLSYRGENPVSVQRGEVVVVVAMLQGGPAGIGRPRLARHARRPPAEQYVHGCNPHSAIPRGRVHHKKSAT